MQIFTNYILLAIILALQLYKDVRACEFYLHNSVSAWHSQKKRLYIPTFILDLPRKEIAVN